jgi:hypothetical protein
MADRAGGEGYWDNFARKYAAVGAPLRPSRDDVRFAEETAAAWKASHPDQRLRALLLGVTPDIGNMRWPEASSLLAVDASMGMARAVWPGNIPQKRWAVCGDWLALPVRDSSCDVVMGDGSGTCVRYPDGFRALAASISRVLSAEGLLMLRCFVQPDARECPEDVFRDLFRTAIPSFHHFKFRLLMALQPCSQQGIAVNDLYRFWRDRKVDRDVLASRQGWEKQAIETIELHNGPNTVHTFPTLNEVRSVLQDFFEEVSISIPAYELGERCPTLTLRPSRKPLRSFR